MKIEDVAKIAALEGIERQLKRIADVLESDPDRNGVWRALEATPGFDEAMERGAAQIAEGKAHPLREG